MIGKVTVFLKLRNEGSGGSHHDSLDPIRKYRFTEDALWSEMSHLDYTGQALGYFYFEEEFGRRSQSMSP
jgi:hypothetical protein